MCKHSPIGVHQFWSPIVSREQKPFHQNSYNSFSSVNTAKNSSSIKIVSSINSFQISLLYLVFDQLSVYISEEKLKRLKNWIWNFNTIVQNLISLAAKRFKVSRKLCDLHKYAVTNTFFATWNSIAVLIIYWTGTARRDDSRNIFVI